MILPEFQLERGICLKFSVFVGKFLPQLVYALVRLIGAFFVGVLLSSWDKLLGRMGV